MKKKELLKRIEAIEDKLGIKNPVDKFSDLKEAFNNGATIQRATTHTWVVDLKPTWETCHEYRIHPKDLNQPKVGDVCKFWDYDVNSFVIALYATKRDDDYFKEFIHGVYLSKSSTRFFKNAQVLTKEESIELLFGKEK
ncbi:hypothetical protein [Sphingobacterium sp. BIGb0116]|uniref:hypothetical protein n=1 Tax=Sphingobacterium sp. BIGb0116 TaxID=2940619 RepID=UPI00216729A3|nr:hypothetical protein [Sphingobacterium sp. BIGb0116]MCS4164416.1 hypothetical protein [Sphingobacterium sp. BIGb0116]